METSVKKDCLNRVAVNRFDDLLLLMYKRKAWCMSTSRLLIVQYAGDYRQTYNHFSNGGEETYYAQKWSVDFVAELGRKIEQVGVLCCTSDVTYDEIVGNRVRAMGAGWTDGSSVKPIFRMINQFRPTHLVLNTPRTDLLNWTMRQGISVLPMFADTFQCHGSRVIAAEKVPLSMEE